MASIIYTIPRLLKRLYTTIKQMKPTMPVSPTTWEYSVLVIPQSQWGRDLNLWGANGWELVTITGEGRLVFKRSLTDSGVAQSGRSRS